MPAIPLGIFAYKRTDGFQPEVRLRNLYLETDKSGASPDGFMRIQRPGLTLYTAFPEPMRGVYQQDGVFDGTAYAVSGSSFFSFSEGAFTFIDTVGSGGRVPFAANYEKLFLLSNVTAYQYDGATITAIAMPDDREVVDIETLNSYLILACPDGRFYWIVPGASVVDPLDFATAEGSPDGLVAVKRLVDELWFFGPTTIEVWQATGDSISPFLRAGGRTVDRGCLARDTVHRFDNSLLWVGNDGIVYRAAQIPTRISDHGIEQRLRERTALPSAMIVETDGHKFYALKIPGQGTFCYDAATQQWCEFSSGETDWSPHVATVSDNLQLLGDEEEGAVWLFNPDVNTDDGETIIRLLTGNVALMGLPPKQDSFSLGVGASADTIIRVRWKDGQDDFPDYYDELEVRAPYDIASMYRLGQPDQPVRSFEISCVEDVRIRISGARWGEAWQ